MTGRDATLGAPDETAPAPRPTGLTSVEARRLLAQHGPNRLPRTPDRRAWRWLRDQLRDPLILILLAALAFDLGAWAVEGAQGVPFETLAIAAILLLNAALGLLQQRRAERALAQLERLAAPRVWVERDGRPLHLPSEELVPGDLVRLEAGDRVPADGAVIDAVGLALDTSVVDGESLPVDRGAGDELVAGTLLVRGGCRMTTLRTGADSMLGRLAHLIGGLSAEPTPLEVRLRRFGRTLARWVVALALGLALFGVLLDGVAHLGEVLLFAVALAVAAVPESLPTVVTTALALGTERMARRRAVVRRLTAVEALGSVTVIASDKTGTLTENRLEVRTVEARSRERMLRAMALVNDTEPDGGAGDPLELALYRHLAGEGIDVARLRGSARRRGGRPFDASWRFMRVTVREPEGDVSYLKGAPEVLLARCDLDGEAHARWGARVEALGRTGQRTVAFAWGRGEREHDLDLLGLVGFWDPLRPGVTDAVAAAQRAGIRVVVVTGDHPATAEAIATAAGIAPGALLTGDDLADLDREGLAEAMAGAAVLARVDPEHKLDAVEALKARGEVVAVTGDGVNDAPALKRSHVGVAMGLRGSEVAREVADVILLDDDFGTIVAAVEEGRTIYANLGKILRFLFATNLAEVLVVTVGLALAALLSVRDAGGALFLPLTAAQILWVNLVTDALPALALTLDRHPDAMRERPRRLERPLLERPSLAFIALTGATLAAAALTALQGAQRLGWSPVEARTLAFTVLVLGQLAAVYGARALAGRSGRNPALHGAVALCAALQLLVLAAPPLRRLLGVVPLPPAALIAGLALPLAVGLLAWLYGRLLRPHDRR